MNVPTPSLSEFLHALGVLLPYIILLLPVAAFVAWILREKIIETGDRLSAEIVESVRQPKRELPITPEKPKHGFVGLSDDGELIDLPDDEQDKDNACSD